MVTPRDLSRIAVGQAAYALVTNEAGGILNDPVVLRLVGDRFWFSLADSDILLWARGLAAPGGEIEVCDPEGLRRARVVSLPWTRRQR